MNYLTKGSIGQLEMFIEEIKKSYDAKGIAVAIVDGSGRTCYENYFGRRDEENELGIDGDTIFGIASCTKSFTSLAILQLQEKGLLDIHDLVSDYIPEFTGKNQPGLRIWHLMCHAGGFFPLERILVDQVAEDLGISDESEGDLAYSDRLAAEGVRRVAGRLDAQTMDKGLIGKPGEYYSYCNDGFGLLSDIIRRVSGKSFADYLKEEILIPLGMDRSGCDFVKPAQDENAAVLYEKRSGQMRGDRDYHNNAFVLNGGGAMKSTINDLKKYLLMYLHEGKSDAGEQILSPAGIREMCRPKISYRPGSAYGSGLSIKTIEGMTIYEHGGSLPGVSSNISFSYEADAAVIVLCNTSDVPVNLIADAAMKAYAGISPLLSRPYYREAPWDKALLKAAEGTYSSGEGTEVRLSAADDGSLKVFVDGSERKAVMLSPRTAAVIGRYSDGFIKLYVREGNDVFAIHYGSRIIPRVK